MELIKKDRTWAQTWGGALFLNRVDGKLVPEYDDVVSHPIALSCMRTKVRDFKYTDISEFLDDVTLLHNNCVAFNTGKPSAGLMKCSETLVKLATKMAEDGPLNKPALLKKWNGLISQNGFGACGRFDFDQK